MVRTYDLRLGRFLDEPDDQAGEFVLPIARVVARRRPGRVPGMTNEQRRVERQRQRQQIEEMIRDGKSAREVAAIFGVSRQRIYMLLAED